MRRLNLVRAAIVAAAFFAGEASACLRYADTVYVGGEPTVEEQRAEARRLAAYGLRLRTREAKRDQAGGIDAARGLAELLVPNVRPVAILGDAFWAGTRPSLSDAALTCPRAYASWRSDQAEATRQIDAEVERRRAAGEGKPAS